jgi:anti-sigma factor RsiW
MKDEPLSPAEEKLTRWIDGTLSEADARAFEQELAADPARASFAREKTEAAALRALLREHLPTDREPPYPDFFNSQILRKIRAEMDPVTADPGREGVLTAIRKWLRSPWLIGAAAAAVIACLAIVSLAGPSHRTRVLSVYSPEPHAIAHSFYASDASAVVIDVEGLDAYPAQREIVGNRGSDTGELLVSVR